MAEQRHFPRFALRLAAKLRIFDQEANADIINPIDVLTENIGQGGMRLTLPRSWDCPQCNNCLGWIYNLGCKLKNNHTQDDTRFLNPKLTLKVVLAGLPAAGEGPLELEGSCVWVKTDVPSGEDSYSVGIAFSESQQRKIAPYLFAPPKA
ncbi:MAG: hypothetical protein ACOY3D_08210 [Candidatus Omnitrophota bacterium]